MDQPPVRPLKNPDPTQAELLAELRQVKGGDLNIFLTMAHHPTMLRRFRGLSGMFRTEGELPHPLQEVIVLRTAWRAGSRYVLARHAVIALASGITETEILSVFNDHDKLAKRDAQLCKLAADEIWTGNLTRSTLMALSGHLDTKQLLEVPVLAGFYRMVCTLVGSFEVVLEPNVTLPEQIQQRIDTHTMRHRETQDE